MNEKDIIQNFISHSQAPSVVQSIGDDCALLNVSQEHQLVLTTDVMVEGRHFVKQSPAYLVGYKLMACNLSDIAAMGAKPKWATLNLTLKEVNQTWLNQFAKGLLSCAEKHGVTLVGGDTTMGNQLVLSLQLAGEVPTNSATLRKMALVDDILYVTGTIGCAGYALKQLQTVNFDHDKINKEDIAAFYQPPSRINLAIELREIINACIDISDGLLHELELLCEQSHHGAILNLETIPVADHVDPIDAITMGDDYELLFTAKKNQSANIAKLANQMDCPITPIGKITHVSGIELLKNGECIAYPENSGYDHLKNI